MFGGNFRFDLTMFCWPRRKTWKPTQIDPDYTTRVTKRISTSSDSSASTSNDPPPHRKRNTLIRTRDSLPSGEGNSNIVVSPITHSSLSTTKSENTTSSNPQLVDLNATGDLIKDLVREDKSTAATSNSVTPSPVTATTTNSAPAQNSSKVANSITTASTTNSFTENKISATNNSEVITNAVKNSTIAKTENNSKISDSVAPVSVAAETSSVTISNVLNGIVRDSKPDTSEALDIKTSVTVVAHPNSNHQSNIQNTSHTVISNQDNSHKLESSRNQVTSISTNNTVIKNSSLEQSNQTTEGVYSSNNDIKAATEHREQHSSEPEHKETPNSEEASLTTTSIITKNSSSDIKTTIEQRDQEPEPKQTSNTEEVSLTDDEMRSARRRIIPTDIDISDLKDPVVLPIRSSVPRISQIKVEKIESIEEEEAQSDDSREHVSQVGFAKEVTIIENDEENDVEMERREGIRATPVNVDSQTEIPKYPKSDEDVLHLKNAFAANDFLENVLKGEALDSVIGAMQERQVTAGEIIIQEGEPGIHMFVSSRGTYEIYVKNRLFATFSDKRVFGELAILYNSKRLATIKAVTNGKLWTLQRDVYQQVVVKSAIQDFEETLSFLKNVPLVNKLSEESMSKVANLLKKEFFKTDTVIVQEGDIGDKFYVIRAGCVTITKEKEGKVSELGRGAFFGERALLKDDRRQATVTADPPGVECLTLTREEFKKHFKDIIVKDGKTFEEGATARPRRNSFHPVNEYSHVSLDDLNRITTLGVGGFGRVELVQHRTDTSVTFALKYLKKIDMVQQEQVEHVFNERDIQINCNSLFIVRMYNTFQDDKYLYFLMESCMGGDLWTYLQKRKGRMVAEMDARFFAACVLEAFAYLHERNYIYRDLKPENLLIDAKGYIKLTDFGFAKNLRTANKTYTFAGTPEYVAPEIIYNRGHDKSVDYWAFGILIFELLVGKTPFRSDDHTNMMTYNRILRGINNVQFPAHVTRSATHLIQKLCRPIPTDRLGNHKNGVDDIRTHKWFQGFEWEKLRNRRLKAPFVPNLKSNIDPKYFEKFNDDDDIPPAIYTEHFSGF